MNEEFVRETEKEERLPPPGCLTGWETIVFQLEDEPPDCCTAAVAP
jgi:hypothetical protein